MSGEPTPAPHDGDGERISPRADLRAALGWLVLGLAILVGSITMDRLERQGINPYTVPGLLPGLLGILMMALGLLLGLRSLARGALQPQGATSAGPGPTGSPARVLLVIGLCTFYGVVLVGHGLPFWLASAIFVTVSIISLQHAQRVASGERLSVRTVLQAVAVGVGSGVIITLVFQELFLVRMP